MLRHKRYLFVKINKNKIKNKNMLNYTKWFSNNYKKSEDFRLKYNELLNSSYITPKNLEDFSNPNYSLSKLDIFKYITVLEYLFKN